MSPWRVAPLLCLALVLALPQSARPQQDKLEKYLQREHQKAAERRTAVQQLSERERQLSGKLSEVDSRMNAAEARIKKQEEQIVSVRQEEAQLTARLDVVRQKRDKTVRELRVLLEALWPLHAQGMHEGARMLDNWDQSDRRFQWTSAVYASARGKLEEVRRQERELADVLARQKELAAHIDQQVALINQDKDALLRDRLALNARLGQVNTQRRDLESDLQGILKTIQQLNYQLASERTRKFEAYKGVLPWPSSGKLVAGFSPEGNPSRRGIGLSVSEGAPVKSVFWGKVVHNDTLRGLGKVVIIYHGNDYYTLYAYLADASVTTGQEVEKDEPIGRAGYYPEAHGNGVYFELRFHQKPINPQLWLMPAQ